MAGDQYHWETGPFHWEKCDSDDAGPPHWEAMCAEREQHNNRSVTKYLIIVSMPTVNSTIIHMLQSISSLS